MHAYMYNSEKVNSRMHEEVKAAQQSEGPTAWDEYRDYYQQYLDNMRRRQAKQRQRESTRTDYVGRSRFERFLEMMHRSSSYRPTSEWFIPIAVLVVLIYGSINVFAGLIYMYRVSQ